MKKSIFLLSVLAIFLILFTTSQNSKAQNFALSGQVGYSWVNGVIGGEVQFGSLGLSVGYFPAKMPKSGDPISSISVAATWYGGSWDYSTYYLTLGYASAGYRSETYYSGSSNTFDKVVEGMPILMFGYRYSNERYFSKAGFGYGWHTAVDEGGVWTWEFSIGMYLFGD